MFKWIVLAAAATTSQGWRACDTGKHETSAPHTTVTLDAGGVRTMEIGTPEFSDGWSVRFERFQLWPTFGVDETDNNKPEFPPIVGAAGYVYGGGEALELTEPGPQGGFDSWVISGKSRGWGMKLHRYRSESGASPAEPSLEVAGVAHGPGGESVRFAFGFTNEIVFAHCVPAGEQSLVLPENGSLHVYVELDGAALFADDLAVPDGLRFGPIAEADADGDGTVTTAELRAEPAPGAASLHEAMSVRLEHLVAASYECEEVVEESCQDGRLDFGACDDTDTANKDADGDGEKNCLDDDIDGDGLGNDVDCDPYTTLASLSTCDGSDRHEKDSDGDGLRNCEDSDIDGDGFSNEHDGRPYDDPYAPAKTQ